MPSGAQPRRAVRARSEIPPGALIIDAIRTPYGRRGGALASWHPVDLLAWVLTSLLERSAVPPSAVDDVIVGCASQVGAQAGNIARRGVLAAGWPESVPGTTVDRQGASSAQAVHWAAQAVMSGTQGLVVAAGVDVMSAVPLGAPLAVPAVGKPIGKQLQARYQGTNGLLPPGRADEEVARHWGLGRATLDDWALSSINRAKRASKVASHLIAVPLEGRRAKPLRADELLANAPSRQAIRDLSPVFEHDGVVTAANMAVEADGAAAVLLASPASAKRLGLEAKARVSALAVGASAPWLWPAATIAATEKAMDQAGTGLSQVERFEVHESSAAAVLAWLAATGVDRALVNPDGGALAVGAPLGAAGAGLFVPAVTALMLGEAVTVLVTMAGEGGVATACLLTAAGS